MCRHVHTEHSSPETFSYDYMTRHSWRGALLSTLWGMILSKARAEPCLRAWWSISIDELVRIDELINLDGNISHTERCSYQAAKIEGSFRTLVSHVNVGQTVPIMRLTEIIRKQWRFVTLGDVRVDLNWFPVTPYTNIHQVKLASGTQGPQMYIIESFPINVSRGEILRTVLSGNKSLTYRLMCAIEPGSDASLYMGNFLNARASVRASVSVNSMRYNRWCKFSAMVLLVFFLVRRQRLELVIRKSIQGKHNLSSTDIINKKHAVWKPAWCHQQCYVGYWVKISRFAPAN